MTFAENLDRALESAVDEQLVPGIVAVLADRSGVVFEGAAGVANAELAEELGIDAVFRIASMTKLVTAISVLQLVERGELDLDTPVASIVPEFGSLQVLDRFDGDTPVLRPARSTAVVRQLLTHTSGLGYAAWHPRLQRYHELTGARELACGKRAAFLEVPLAADPGTEFNYSTSLDWAGLVVENVSGRSIDEQWRAEILDPLGLDDTLFMLDDSTWPRAAAVHVRPEGTWVATEIDLYGRDADPPEFFAAGHCLYSTAADFLRLQRAILAGGQLDGIRLLSEDTVAWMFAPQLGAITIPVFPAAQPDNTAEVDLGPGATWGLGQWVTTRRRDGLRLPGSGGWLGLFNTSYWIDPTTGITGGIYTQTLPFYEPGVMVAFERFERACYAGS